MEDWTLDLTAEQIFDADALAAAILARSGTDVIGRITLTGSLEFLCDLEDVAEAVRPRFHYLELHDRTDLLESGLLRRIQGEATIRGYFVRKMLERIDNLQERHADEPDDGTLRREVEVARLALKTGLEQFLEEEPATGLLEPEEEPVVSEEGATNGAHAAGSEPPEKLEYETTLRSRALVRQDLKRGEMSAEDSA
jgi:hypothetical protein